ncbi:MAG TPA: hypothetical protein VMM35_07480 [Longimicrobiales bacterium]|nr:hypothetical protein [Longimicrobiales bacterium]
MDERYSARREYAQLLRLHDRLSVQLRRIRDELEAPGTGALVREITRRTGSTPGETLSEVLASVEQGIRSLKLAASRAQLALLERHEEVDVEGIDNLPPSLSRFLAERGESSQFHYDVLQDEVRGWVVRWKERTHDGDIRGCGQFYERPYAWLDD